MPQRPRYSSPLSTIPAPMPVPTVISTTWPWPRPAPNLASAHAAAFASFSTITGRPVRSSTARATGSWRQARLGANRTADRLSSTKPAAPMPTAPASCLASSSRTASLITSIVLDALAAGVGRLTISMIAPSSSTTPAAILVPPTSTPMVRLMPGFPRPACRRRPARCPPAGRALTRLPGLPGGRRAVGQHRIDARQRVTDRAGHDLGEVGDRHAGVALAGARPRDPPRRAAHRAPGALRRLVQGLGRRHGPDVLTLPAGTVQRLAHLVAQLVAHAPGALPDQPLLHLPDEARRAPLPRLPRATAGAPAFARLLAHPPHHSRPSAGSRPSPGPGAAPAAAAAHRPPARARTRAPSPRRAVSVIVFSARRFSIPGNGTESPTRSS